MECMEGCSLVVWDGKYRRKAVRMMRRDGAALMSCWGEDDGKVEEDKGLRRKPRMEIKERCVGMWRKNRVCGSEEGGIETD
jgi:hypothetical protein